MAFNSPTSFGSRNYPEESSTAQGTKETFNVTGNKAWL
jgi:hypothetical protein